MEPPRLRRSRRRQLLKQLIVFASFVVTFASSEITYEDKVETPEAIFETVHGNCPGNFLLDLPYYCPSCGANGGDSTTLDECAGFCVAQGDECRGFTVSSADGKCFPKTIDGCASPQQNGINLFYSKRPKSALQIYNFTIDHVNPGQPATARCLVSGFPAPTAASNFRFEFSNGTKVPGEISVTAMTPTSVEGTIDILSVQESGQYILCSVQSENGRASEWALTRVYALPVVPDAPQIAEADFPVYRLVKWRQFQEGDIGDGPVDNYYVYIRKENEDWGIYGKTEIPAVVACQQSQSPCQKRIGPLLLNTRYAVSVAAIRDGQGGVGKMSPVTIFKTPCENITDITTPPNVLLDPSSPGHIIVIWDRRGEFCIDEGNEANRVIGYRLLLTSLLTGWTLDTNVSAPGYNATCRAPLPLSQHTGADNCSTVHLYDMSQNSYYDISIVRVSFGHEHHVRSKPIRFKTPCGKPFAKVNGIRVSDWVRIPTTNLSTMVLSWNPISPKDTGCDSVERFLIRIYDKHPSTYGAWPIRNLTVSGQETNVTITRIVINVPYYAIVNYRNNEQIDSSPSELVPFRLEPEAAQATKGPLPGIDMTMLIGLVVGAAVLTICLTGLVIFIIMRGKRGSFSSDTDSPPSNRKSSVSSATDLPPNTNGVYINVNGNGNGNGGIPHHGNHHHPQPYGDDSVDGELVLKSNKKSRRRATQQQDNVMYSKAVRHSSSNGNGIMVNGNGTANGHPTEDEAVYNTRLDAAIGQQKF